MSAYEQSQRFLATSPRPKRRQHTSRKPGAPKGPDSVLHITEDVDRGLALIRGLNVRRVLELAFVLESARWSPAAKGYVVPVSALPDIAAMSDYTNTPWRVKRVKADD